MKSGIIEGPGCFLHDTMIAAVLPMSSGLNGSTLSRLTILKAAEAFAIRQLSSIHWIV